MAAFTTNLSGVTQLDNSIVVEYAQQFLIAAAQEAVMDQFASINVEIGAKEINMTKYAQLALVTSALTETDDLVSEAMSDSIVTLTPAEYGNVVTRTALASLQSGGKADLAAAKLVGINMARSQDKLAMLALEASGNAVTVDGGLESALDATDIATRSFVNVLYNKLSRASVPKFEGGTYVMVAHDDVIHDLRNDTAAGSWVDVTKYASPETVLKNEVGMIGGFRFVRNNHGVISADAGAAAVDTYKMIALGANALGKAVSKQPELRITGPYDKLARFLNIGWYGCFKYGIVDTDACWVGICASSVGANT